MALDRVGIDNELGARDVRNLCAELFSDEREKAVGRLEFAIRARSVCMMEVRVFAQLLDAIDELAREAFVDELLVLLCIQQDNGCALRLRLPLFAGLADCAAALAARVLDGHVLGAQLETVYFDLTRHQQRLELLFAHFVLQTMRIAFATAAAAATHPQIIDDLF